MKYCSSDIEKSLDHLQYNYLILCAIMDRASEVISPAWVIKALITSTGYKCAEQAGGTTLSERFSRSGDPSEIIISH